MSEIWIGKSDSIWLHTRDAALSCLCDQKPKSNKNHVEVGQEHNYAVDFVYI